MECANDDDGREGRCERDQGGKEKQEEKTLELKKFDDMDGGGRAESILESVNEKCGKQSSKFYLSQARGESESGLLAARAVAARRRWLHATLRIPGGRQAQHTLCGQGTRDRERMRCVSDRARPCCNEAEARLELITSCCSLCTLTELGWNRKAGPERRTFLR